MPHLNRSLSSPSLRDPSKSVLDELSSRSIHSMSHSRSPSSRSSYIRSFSARRPRPSIASIADIFVSSLVLAGFCHEHSPRGRGLSTLAFRASETNARRPRRRDGAIHEKSAVQRHWQFPGLSVQQSQPRSWFSQGLAQVEHFNLEKQDLEPGIEQRLNESDGDLLPRLPEVLDQPSQDHFFDTIPAGYRLVISSPRALICFIPKELTPSERKRLRAAAFYQRLLGDTYWELALDAVMPQDLEVRPRRREKTRDQTEIESVAALVEALRGGNRGTQYLFNLYRDIPEPGVAYLSRYNRDKLLSVFAASPNRRWVDSRRYLALVEDMIQANFPMSLQMWTSAIYMSGRSHHGKLSRRRMVRAIGIWQKMEHQAGIRADDVVFNILFDIAIKANHYTVADRLEEEMQRRGVKFSRSGLVSKIYSCGMRHDLTGIRENFEKFVQQGQLVDTVVLNCLMAAFLRAGDKETAEQLYARMIKAQVEQNKSRKKSSSGESPPTNHKARLSPEFTHYRSKNREIGRLLKMSSRLRESLPDCHKALQESLPMTPDSRTFYIWLQQCALTGDLEMFMNVLRDMEQTFEIPPRHLVYMLLFQGFSLHGRHRKRSWDSEKGRWKYENQQWTEKKLRLTWISFLSAVRDSRARQDGQPRKYPISWENPLRDLDTEYKLAASQPSTDPHELYMNLPIKDPKSSLPTPKEKSQIRQPSSVGDEDALDQEEEDEEDEDEEEEDIADVNLDPEGIFLSSRLNGSDGIDKTEPDGQTLNYISSRLENGVFVGRAIVINILKAFGACSGPDEVLEAWMQLEGFWPHQKRKATDMLAVNAVLQDALERGASKPGQKEKTDLKGEGEEVKEREDVTKE
ncbi:uncharacterized protein N7483_007101 [Penicillium malachiteum]|uniref:uncharacterized protein n=1 Tax=Penicillium malachiteum TaxID=1324776 RepID=UPI00254867E5|nr:uncharacterized protein N7483_007101 [Penicillium malachiteum]KAJ5725744.1 hypothetical protein N7483_007101 [Penicillium malachiteum]